MSVVLCPWEEPLLVAAVNGQIAKVQKELDKGQNVDSHDLEYGRAALAWAAECGHEDIVQLLLARMQLLDIYWKQEPIWTSKIDVTVGQRCHGRRRRAHEKTVENLLNGNAAVDLVDKRHRTPMAWCAMKGHTSVVKLCLRWNASTATERLDELQELFRTVKPDFDWRNQGGELLLWAIENDREEDVEFLIQQGADVNALDDNWMTPLSNAAHKRLSYVAKLLLERDIVDLDHVDTCDRAPISWVAESGDVEIARLLMERNVNLELKDETGMTPLLWTAMWEHEEIVSMLLDRGVGPNCEDENLRTALSFAAENGQNSLISLLLEKGALPNKVQSNNR
ncbi:hypothetical protein N8T08_000420 [Aspergillus melleus]|uniref:Uncharacterized protein n=1 Tax=Aspergillus melleus TaxID=138277 RepID=A0ACC3BBN5_9EURO|nr:hypothetical protein N8T08_000420 [Aspergillus melleus]